MWNIKILTLFPEAFPGVLGHSVLGNALGRSWSLKCADLRNYANDRHKTVDDTPYGGGSGMVMRADVVGAAIEQFFDNDNPKVYLTPRGRLFTQGVARELTKEWTGINILCGRFEGLDERVIIEYDLMELSLGDFVLSSGDVAALSIIDCCVRLLPDVLENSTALQEESFGEDPRFRNLLEYPHYTRPAVWKGMVVPEILKGGNHQEVARWRYEMARQKTNIVRPELLLKGEAADQFNKGDKNE